jgi:LAO/AO transport system kinase
MDVQAPQDESQTLWIPPIHKTVSTEGKGIAELAGSIARHVQHLQQTGDWAARDRARLGSVLEAALREALVDRFMQRVSNAEYERVIEQVIRRTLSPDEAVEGLLSGSPDRTE